MPHVSIKTPKLLDEILDRLSRGEPLAQICRDDGMPTPNGFRDWTKADEGLAIAYARAREDGFDMIAADALTIADTQEIGETLTHKADGSIERKTEDMLGHRKFRFEARMKLLAKWDPRRYGDKAEVHHTGAVAAPTVALSDDQNEAARQYRDFISGISEE